MFAFAFSVDVGKQEFQRVLAQNATTSLRVLNTPPRFTTNAHEVTVSATNTPINSGDVVEWTAVGVDSNSAPYFLLICSSNATPTANRSAMGSPGTAPPSCGAGSTQWAVSTSTASGATSTASATLVEGGAFGEVNDWFAWVCDDDPVSAACNLNPVQGLASPSSSSAPFYMNHRPTLTSFNHNNTIDPGGTLNFSSVSSDSDSVGGDDTLTLIVCQDNTSFSTSTDSCSGVELASSTNNVTTNATATYALASVVRDQTYPAYAYLVDNHGHEANAPIQLNFTVNNVAPTVANGSIDINEGSDITLTTLNGQTTGFTLDFTVSDNNSCLNSASSSEVTGFKVSLYRSNTYGTSTCNAASHYNPNHCYNSSVATTTWNLSCTASTTSCTGATDSDVDYSCTFPLWFLTDPTDGNSTSTNPYAQDEWLAAVSGIDDDNASSTLVAASVPVDVLSFAAFNLVTPSIPYGALAPGDDTNTLSASTTIRNVGNTCIDQLVQGTDMCSTFTATSTCPVSATSTIPAGQQRFSTTSTTYLNPNNRVLSSTSPVATGLDIPETTATSTLQQGITYWGIEVPGSIQVAGSYQGLNTFSVQVSSSTAW